MKPAASIAVATDQRKAVYFPGLNGIRAIAASLVIFMHFNQFAYLFKISRFYPDTELAGIAVTIFFVLSGFLITYLLIEEKLRFGTISLSRFYTRRILRIWPLYYTIIILSFLIYWLIPFLHVDTDLNKIALLFVFFLPNYAYAAGLSITPVTPLWSIGVEEQFYAVWPWLFRNVSAARLKYTLLIFLLAFWALKIFLRYYSNDLWYSLISNTRIDCMAIGGLGAYVLKMKKEKLLRVIYHPATQALAWAVLVFTIAYKPIHVASIFDHQVYAVFALVLIMNVSTNPATLVNLEHRLFDFLGKISYGLYVYHMPLICLLAYLMSGLSLPNSLPVQIGMFLLVYLVTVSVAALSYRYFESKFIHIKERFSRVLSRASSRQSA
jgi:peptidoglycan/LPS O-acetylase OafA/YrhL